MAGHVRRMVCLAAIAAVVPGAVTACGGELKPGDNGESSRPAKSLVWDVSRGHTTDEVQWPSDTDAFQLGRGVQVKLTLPEGKTFNGRVEKVMGLRHGKTVRYLDLFYPAASTDEAYKRAKRLGKQWSISLRNIDAWYKRRVEGRKAGKEDLSDTAFTGGPASEALGGPDGPKPAIEMLNSFGRERPVVVNLKFVWPRTPETDG